MLSLTKNIESLFLEVCNLPSAADVESWLESRCEDQAVRRTVIRLVEAHRKTGDFLDSDCWVEDTGRNLSSKVGCEVSGDSVTASDELDLSSGMDIGAYKLVCRIGQGGMGQVWLARRPPPIDVNVAIKFLFANTIEGYSQSIFEVESRSLMRLDHPGIARILDGGWFGQSPYLVMEYIDGVRLSEFGEKKRLGMDVVLGVARTIAEAVLYAHQRGIVHRDLKPANVMLVRNSANEVPRAKLIDFGLAHEMPAAVDCQTSDVGSSAIREPMRGGTLEYMAPEQLSGAAGDADLRCDVYGFGGILYFLLTGEHPWENRNLRHMPRRKAVELILDEYPERPSEVLSRRLNEIEQSGVQSKANRLSNQRDLRTAIKDCVTDLDWIVMKCLAKQMDQRYASIDACLEDINRFALGRPIAARAQDRSYEWSKSLRRNRVSIIVALLLMCALVAGLLGVSFGWFQSSRSLALVTSANSRTQTALKEAEENEANALEQRKIAATIREFLQYDLLLQSDPVYQANSMLSSTSFRGGAQANPTVRELLDRVALKLAPDNIDKSYPTQWMVQSAMLRTVGESYAGIGSPDKAIEFLRRAVETQQRGEKTDSRVDMRSVLQMRAQIANAHFIAGRRDESLKEHKEVLEERKTHLPPDDRETLQSCNNVAWLLQNTGKVNDALRIYEDTYQRMISSLGNKHPDLLGLKNNWAVCLQANGDFDAALKMIREVASGRAEVLGKSHPETLQTWMNVGSMSLEQGNVADAISVLEGIRSSFAEYYHEDHPSHLAFLSNLALAYQRAGENTKAIGLLEAILDIKKRKLGNENPSTWMSVTNLALALQASDRNAEAIELFREAYAFFSSKFPLHHPLHLASKSNLGGALVAARKLEEGEVILAAVVEEKGKALGVENPSTWYSQRQLGVCRREMGLTAQAIELLSLTYEKQLKKLGAENLETLTSAVELAAAFQVGKEYQKAAELLESTLPVLKQNYGESHPEYKRAVGLMSPKVD